MPSPQTCLPAGKAVPESKRRLTKRDIAILQDLSDLRFVTAKDLALLHASPASLTYVRERASFLAGNADHKEGEYLFRLVPPRTTGGAPERVYALGGKGAQALAAITGNPVSWYYQPSRSFSFSFLRHALFLTRIISALTYFVRSHPQYSLTERRLFYELARMQMSVTDDDKEKRIPLPVIPDAWVRLKRSDGQEGIPLWIEADCGTEMRDRYLAYQKARLDFLLSGDYERVFGTSAVLMLVITTGQIEAYKDQRRQALQRFTQEVLAKEELEDWADVFQFAAVGYMELFTSSIFDAPLWYPADSQTPAPLFSTSPTPTPEEKDHGHDDTPDKNKTNS